MGEKKRGKNYEGTNVESAEQLVAKPSCKSVHSTGEKLRMKGRRGTERDKRMGATEEREGSCMYCMTNLDISLP